jgi:flagellar biosynthesis/type III secretory pathway M-ring protein FliF/YscJ
MPGWRRDGEYYTSDFGKRNGSANSRDREITPWQPPKIDDGEKNQVVPYRDPPKPSRRAFLERQIQDFIKQRPEDVAEVIKRWLREDQE